MRDPFHIGLCRIIAKELRSLQEDRSDSPDSEAAYILGMLDAAYYINAISYESRSALRVLVNSCRPTRKRDTTGSRK